MNANYIDLTNEKEPTHFENFCCELDVDLITVETDKQNTLKIELQQDFMHVFGKSCISNGVSPDKCSGAMVIINVNDKCITCDTCFGRSYRGINKNIYID